jgi:hypothetical protein
LIDVGIKEMKKFGKVQVEGFFPGAIVFVGWIFIGGIFRHGN